MKRLLVSFFTVLVSIEIFAGNVTEQQALTIARQFMQGKSFQQKQVRRAAAVGDNQFYVFNAEGQNGFVIVSADDRTIPVLGYADKGSLELDKLPVNARRWLESYAEQIKALGDDVQTDTHPRRVLGAPVSPLLTCQWDQGAPYNLQCPTYGEDHCVTGCVATAMAQVMYYHKWPEVVNATLPSYMTAQSLYVDELPPTAFKWGKMKDEYVYDETGESADAVAELMRYCGQAVQMNYRLDESASTIFASVMTHYFGYGKTARNITRSTYSSIKWESIIYQELSNKRPVLYSGNSGSGGHQFVIDGYDNKGLFHVNWGWGGYADGFFSLSILNPYGRGIGGGTSSNGYTMEQDAIIGLQPDKDALVGYSTLYCRGAYSYTSSYTRNSSSENFTNVGVYGQVMEYGIWDITFDHAWVLCKDGEKIQELDVQKDLVLNTSYDSYNSSPIKTISANLSFGAELADGVYELRQMTSSPGANQWEFCQNTRSDFLLAEISGNTLTLKSSDQLEGTIQVNDVTVKGVLKTNRDMSAVINWTNKGYNHETPLYLYLDWEKVGSVSSYVDRGETGDVEIAFTSQYAGTKKLKVSTDPSGYNIVYEKEITIEEATQQNLSTNFDIEGEKKATIEGTTINATITFTNNGDNAYDDLIIVHLSEFDSEGYWVGDVAEVVKPLQLAAGAQGNVQVQFADLKPGVQYGIYAYYYSTGLSQAGAYWITVGKVLAPADLNISTTIANAKNSTIEGTTAKLDITLKNNSTYDYNDRIDVDIYYFDADNNLQWEKEQRFNIEIPAGQTKVVKDYEITGLKIGKSYVVYISYYSEGDYEWGGHTETFTMTNPTINTKDNPFSVSDILPLINALSSYDDTDYFYGYVTGYVSSIDQISTYYGNATFYITDYADGTGTPIYVYRVKGLDNKDITDPNLFKVGDKVVVYGKFINYHGNKPEISNDGYIVSINAGSSAGISNITQKKDFSVPTYNLSGQRVSANHKGIIIKNGKKYVVK